MKKTLGFAMVLGLVLSAVTGCSGTTDAQQAQTASGATPVTETAKTDTAAAGDTANRPGPERFVQKFDKNGNGALEQSEVPERMWQHIQVADTDKNGSVTAAELKAAHDSGALGEDHHHGRGHHGDWFKKLDTNGDGAITKDEAGDHWDKISKADANGDGKVTQDELKAAHEARERAREQQGSAAPQGT